MGIKRRSVSSSDNNNNSSVVSGNLKNGQEYEGRLIYVADLGLQERSYEGVDKEPAYQYALGIEIIGESIEYEDGTKKPKLLWSKPFYTYEQINIKGGEYKLYKVFDPSIELAVTNKYGGIEDFETDWDSQLNKPCSVTIKHFIKNKGKDNEVTYDNIGSIGAIPRKYQEGVGESTIKPCIGDSDDKDNAATKALYGLVKTIFDRRLNEGAYVSDDNDNGPEYPDDMDVPF